MTQRPDGVWVIRRDVFAAEYFRYKHGEHVVFGGPSTRGKTSLAFDLMEHITTPNFPAYVAVSKPKDKVTNERGQDLGFRFVHEWPPPKQLKELFGGEKPRGYIVQAKFGDLGEDMERSAILTERLLRERYNSGASPKNKGGILVMDDTMVKAKIQGLDNMMVTILAMAGAMKYGLWVFLQKPTDSGRTTLWGYENATHVFLTRGNDSQMLKRYGEIAGDANAKTAMAVLPTLKPYQFLYIHKYEDYLCIVDAK